MQTPARLSKQELLDLVEKQSHELAQSQDIIRQLESRNDELQKAYTKLWNDRFSAKSERYIADPDQIRIDFGGTDDAADAAEGIHFAIDEADLIPAYERRKPKRKDRSLPAHLPRREVIIDADQADKTCPTHGEKQLLPESMWDVGEKLVVIPATYEVITSKYKKYVCVGKPECGIASAERPTGIVEGDKYDASVAAQIITFKYGFHLPLYRLQDMFAGSGWTPSRGLMLNILNQCFFIIAPLLDFFKKTLLGDSIIACDDTGVTLLYPKTVPEFDLSDPRQKRAAEVYAKALDEKKSSINAKFWAYRGGQIKLNLFDFTVSRHRDGPEFFFDQYRGTILGDCWHGFGSIAAASDGKIVRAACNAHARRKFENATDYPADRRKWMDWFAELYDVESEAKEQVRINDETAGNESAEPRKARQEVDAVLALRHAKAKPIWKLMREELKSIEIRTKQVVLPKSDLRKALNYLDNHWDELTRYLDDSKLPIDNNECEQLMKQAAVARKNWLFCGSIDGGERNAGFMSLVSSAHRNDLDALAYVTDILKRLLAGETDYEPMLPWNWAKANPESIREYRKEENKERVIRKQSHRAKRRAQKRRQAKLKDR